MTIQRISVRTGRIFFPDDHPVFTGGVWRATKRTFAGRKQAENRAEAGKGVDIFRWYSGGMGFAEGPVPGPISV